MEKQELCEELEVEPQWWSSPEFEPLTRDLYSRARGTTYVDEAQQGRVNSMAAICINNHQQAGTSISLKKHECGHHILRSNPLQPACATTLRDNTTKTWSNHLEHTNKKASMGGEQGLWTYGVEDRTTSRDAITCSVRSNDRDHATSSTSAKRCKPW
jgi:hypothetical protein